MRALVVSPEVDPLTRYLRTWSKKLISKNRNNGHQFFHFDKQRVTRKGISSILSKQSLDLVFLNGHGAADRIAGYNGEIIIDSANAGLLAGSSVHALSCDTAQSLGPYAVQKGAKAYIGYNAPFICYLQDDHLSNPTHDDTAALFLDSAFTAPQALLNNKSAEEAVQLTRKAYNDNIRKALNSDIQSDNDQFIPYLLWDREHLTSCTAQP